MNHLESTHAVRLLGPFVWTFFKLQSVYYVHHLYSPTVNIWAYVFWLMFMLILDPKDRMSLACYYVSYQQC